MKKAKRLCALFLSAVLLASVISCGKTPEESETTPAPVSAEPSAETEAAPETETKLQPDLPEKTYGGTEFHFLSRAGTVVGYISTEISAEEETGEILNDMVFARNLSVEDRFDIKIIDTPDTAPAGVISSLILAGDPAYEVFVDHMESMSGMVSKHYLQDMRDIPYINLDMPWWNKEAMSSAAVLDQLYIGLSDILLNDKQRAYITIVSKDLMQKYDMEVPYNDVREGTWTMDKMRSMAEIVVSDLNGDGVMDERDQFGIATEYYAAVPMFIGAGCRLTQPDSEGVPVSVMYSEYSVDVVNTIMDMLTDRNLSAIAQNYKTDAGDSYYRIGIDLMQESRVLFVIGMVAWVQDIIQHSDAYPAVLPMPKYSAEQEEYATILQSHHANSLGVPGYLTGDRPELTGVVLEAMSAFSHYSIYPEYINTVVKSRYAVDEDTTEMLGIVFDHITNDPGILFNWGGMSQILSSDLFLGKPGGFASIYASKEKYINMTISKAVDSLRP